MFDTAGLRGVVNRTDIKGSFLVIDSGNLIHLVFYAWKKGVQFESVINAYVSHVRQAMTFGSHKSCTIVFDGHMSSTAKDHDHQARYSFRALEVTFNVMFDSK